MHSNHMHLNFYVFYRIDYKLLLAGGSAIDGSEPTLFMGLYNFSVADPITRSNWDVGSAHCWWMCL